MHWWSALLGLGCQQLPTSETMVALKHTNYRTTEIHTVGQVGGLVCPILHQSPQAVSIPLHQRQDHGHWHARRALRSIPLQLLFRETANSVSRIPRGEEA